MFGKHLEEAEAKVLFIELVRIKAWRNTAAEPSELFEVILEVRTRDGQLFRTNIKEHFNPYHSPGVGDIVKVQYDPKSKAVKVITKGDARYDRHAREQARRARHDEILAAPAGTPLPSTGGPSGSEDDDLAELVRMELEEYQQRRRMLMQNGADGTALILRCNKTGAAVPPLVCYAVDVEIRPLLGSAPFTCSLPAWIDPHTHPIVVGSTVQVKYDPQDTARAILL